MDSLLYFLRFKVLDRSGLTLRIVLFIISALILLCLINFVSYRFLFADSLSPFEYLELLLFDPMLNLIWVPEIVLIAVFGAILLWFLVVFIPWIREVLGLITTPCTFSFEPEECLNNIDFQGKVQKRDKELSITCSGSGMLFKHYWKDFNAEFEIKFEGENGSPLKTSHETTKLKNEYCTKNNYLGFIFRARDFDNYFMLSIGVKEFSKRTTLVCEDGLEEKTFLLITPHIRVGGAWDVFREESHLLSDVSAFNVADYNKLIIQVKGHILKLWIEKQNQKQAFFTCHLPTHYLINWGKEKEADSHAPGDSSKIPFRNSIGRIGFRAYGEEKFWIRNLTITTL